MRGRPKKPEEEVRKNVLRIRLTNDERTTLDQAAERQGEETSTWARQMLLAMSKGSDRKKQRSRPEGN